MDIQLCLPVQTLWNTEWKTLRDTYCQIQEHGWEATLPCFEGLEIPPLTQIVNRVCEQWTWHLRSHTGASLAEWHCDGISQNFPALIFDAWTGDRLLTADGLKGSTEIICFVASSTRIKLSDGIELLDSFVSCSITGWRGQQLHLTVPEAQIIFHFPNSMQSLRWSQFQTEHPDVRGLRLKGKQAIYLEVPTIWHPPLTLSKSLNILIEDLTHRTLLTQPDETVTLAAAPGWQRIALSQWITRSGSYAVRLWNQGDRWSEQFEVRSGFELSQPPNGGFVKVCDRSQTPVETPIQAASPAEFWLSELTLRGLWTLEEVTLLLTNSEATQRDRQQASPSGTLTINLVAWRDVLPDSNRYALSYQRQGEDIQHLVSIGFEEEISPTPPPTLPQSSTPLQPLLPSTSQSESPLRRYQVELQNNTRTMRQAFNRKLSAELRTAHLERSIRTIQDSVLTDFIFVELNSQEHLSALQTIRQRIADQLHTVITIREWSR